MKSSTNTRDELLSLRNDAQVILFHPSSARPAEQLRSRPGIKVCPASSVSRLAAVFGAH